LIAIRSPRVPISSRFVRDLARARFVGATRSRRLGLDRSGSEPGPARIAEAVLGSD
jgi:hypothetical protein